MAEWKDKTTYSRTDKERTPTCFEAKNGSLAIVITCGHIDYRGEWIMHCHRLGISSRPLNCSDMETAKQTATGIVITTINKLMGEAMGFIDE